ncbi:MAG TPA: hypothetical protein VH477_11195 [Bryobacteraceae bacterium]
MWQHQIWAIAWAQFRIARNHLPRTTFGTIVSWMALALWYGMYGAGAILLAVKLPEVPGAKLTAYLPAGLLGVFLFWQIIPLFTLSSGWSLELKKLQIYPIKNDALFALETLLRITSAPEMLILLAGTAAGLLRHADIPFWAPFALVLFVPFNLFLQLAIRDLILHSFERNRFRELFAVLVIGIAIIPQILLRTELGRRMLPRFFAVGANRVTPWHAIGTLSLGYFRLTELALSLGWIALVFLLARWIFNRSLLAEDTLRPGSAHGEKQRSRAIWSAWPARVFRDPVAALLEKELQSLVRMPKFRVLFGMACLLGILVFVPAALNSRDAGGRFLRENLIPVMNVYGLLLLSDTLLLNSLGLDRAAAQIYFVTPLSLSAVLKAKNLTAIVFVILQSAVILFVAALARAPITAMGILSGLLASSVVTVFLLIVGNFTSLSMARPIDPRQTFKKQAGAKMQIWLLGCSLGLFVLVGFAFLARYALQSDLALIAVLCFELLVGLIVYRLGLESAVERGMKERETIVQTLSRSSSPLSTS